MNPLRATQRRIVSFTLWEKFQVFKRIRRTGIHNSWKQMPVAYEKDVDGRERNSPTGLSSRIRPVCSGGLSELCQSSPSITILGSAPE